MVHTRDLRHEPWRYRLRAFVSKPANLLLVFFLIVLVMLSLLPMATMLSNMFTVHVGTEKKLLRLPVGSTTLRHFQKLFAGDDVYKSVKVLSGGEKVRCMLSRMMLSGANFLVLDQPTNHLDLESIAALNNGLEAFKYNIIFSCHDHQLTQTVANRIIEITDDGIIDRVCTYDEYMHISDLETGARE